MIHRRSRAAGAVELPRLPGNLRIERLTNGLTVGLLANPQAPIVATALAYRAGTRDEKPGRGGVAHFLEHMMFKGSARYGPGEIDRRTQALGGANNAFTSHDATVYHFTFAADRWQEALAIEADRMATLTLDPQETESERRVILEEIAMYANEPWDSLEMATTERLFGAHPYGKPVLGTREELLSYDEKELRRFHAERYRPENAVLVVAGDLPSCGGDDEVLAAVERAFRGFAPSPEPAPARNVGTPTDFPRERVRLHREKGEVPRLLLALPAPAANDADRAAVELVSLLLSGGRASRLQRALVDDGQLCAWVDADVSDHLDAGYFAIHAEAAPGVEPARIEAALWAELDGFRREVQSAVELARAQQIAVADWVFEHEKVHQQALAAAMSIALYTPDHIERQLRALLEVDREEAARAAERWLDPERGSVLGWSLPSPESTEDSDDESTAA